ncbi:hypothetical protein COCVIDRAFT_103243 [Bipolaris victoriae FI3]|uniref:Rhodopsin domain-containing protein n=1 Tax=Bipolaris victoriae (strain FI3) TaxID=930091 RepID=W7EBM1_BIPV3|nr:hypothetical protein COCVIDRAFT_103243 [Bipolaris victoriae FI3]
MAFSTASPSDYRFARITPHDHSATLWIIIILSPIYATLVLGIRLGYTKWRAYGFDDLVVILAHVVGAGMWVTLLTSIGHGLGKSYDILDDVDIPRSGINHCVSSVSVFNPLLKYPLIDQIPWMQALTIIDIITECFTVLIPLLGLYRNKMHVEDKAIVMVAFFTRIPNVVFSLIYLIAYSKFVNERQTAIQIVPTVVWQSTLLCYSLISATTPTLKGFTQGFKTTGLSLEYARDLITGELSGARTSIALRPLTTSRPSSIASANRTILQAHSISIQDNSKENSKSATLASKARDGSRCCRGESSSIASRESRQVMSKKEWKVPDIYRL